MSNHYVLLLNLIMPSLCLMIGLWFLILSLYLVMTRLWYHILLLYFIMTGFVISYSVTNVLSWLSLWYHILYHYVLSWLVCDIIFYHYVLSWLRNDILLYYTPYHIITFFHNCSTLTDMPLLLSSCDYIINTLPDTTQTRHLLSENMFSHCAQV